MFTAFPRLWAELTGALRQRKWRGTKKRVNASYGSVDDSGRFLEQAEMSDLVHDEPVREILQKMMPWVDFSSERVNITVNKDFQTKRHRDRNKGFSYFAQLGDNLVGGSCVLDGGRRCDQKELWYVMDGYVYPHWTEFWVPEEEGGVRFTVVVYCKGGEGSPGRATHAS